MKKCPLFRAAISKRPYGYPLVVHQTHLSMLQVFSIAECWLGRLEKQRKRHAERDPRQRKTIRLDADLFVRAAGQSEQREISTFYALGNFIMRSS